MLSARGKTVREIAAATGVSKSAVARDLAPPETDSDSHLSQSGTNDREDGVPAVAEKPPAPVPEAVTPQPDPVTVITEPRSPEPRQCPGCAELGQLLADRSAVLQDMHGQAEALRLTAASAQAELKAVTADRDRLAARVAELTAKPSAAPIASVRPDPEPQAPDDAHREQEAPPEPKARRGARTTCGGAGTARFRFVAGGQLVSIGMPDGRKVSELWLCGGHQEELSSGELELDPAGDGGYDFDKPCQFPLRAVVTA